MYECGLVEDVNVVSVAEIGDFEELLYVDKNSNVEFEKEFDEILEGNSKY